MPDVIAVLNAGSSSFKFSLFAQDGDALSVVVRGQAEGLQTAPRFVAKSADGTVLEEKKWGEGVSLWIAATAELVKRVRGLSR